MMTHHFTPEDIADENTLNSAWGGKINSLNIERQIELDALELQYREDTKAELEAYEASVKEPLELGQAELEPHNKVFKEKCEENQAQAMIEFNEEHTRHKEKIQELEDKFFAVYEAANEELAVHDKRVRAEFAKKTKKQKAKYDVAVKPRYEEFDAAVQALNAKYQALGDKISAEGKELQKRFLPVVH